MFRLKGTAKLYAGATLAALAVSSIPATGAQGNSDCPNGREIALINGRIHTMDASNSVVSAVTMRNGKFVSVGHDAGGAAEAGCKQVINLKGRLVIPGLVDNHNHIVLLGLRPGYHTPLETAASFADIRATYSERIQGAPAGAFVTTIGGFNPVQLAEENPRRRSRAARLPLSCRYADEQRSPVSNDRRQRHPGRAGSDSAQISTLNPWLMLYYMVTGKNSSGQIINAGQTLTRDEALRLYTAANGWFVKEDDKLGSIEEGKLADLVVPNDDYFSVPDESLKKLESILTIVGGRVVYDAGVLRVQDR